MLTAVRGMVVHAVSAGQGPAGLVPLLYEVADDRDLPEQARGEDGRMAWRMRARHRLREPETAVDRASDEEIVALLRACRSARDRLIVLLMARAGLRRGEVCGLRRSDVHLLADSRRLGCEVARAHLHVIRREDNPNGAWAKSRRQRAVPLDFLVVQAFDTYEFERMRVPQAGPAISRWSTCSAARSARRCARTRSGSCSQPVSPGRAGPRSARISCGTPAAATPPMPAPASMWSLTCSDTRRSPPLRSTFIPMPPGCGPRWTRCPALASAKGAAGDRHGTGRDLRSRPAAGASAEFPHVLDGVVLDGAAARLAEMLDRALLDEADGIRRRGSCSCPRGHRLLGRQVCRAEGCAGTVHNDCPGVCYRCFTRLKRLGMSAADIAAAGHLPAAPAPAEDCAVPGCRCKPTVRQAVMCEPHAQQFRDRRTPVPLEQFLTDRRVRPLPPLPACLVAACTRTADGAIGYCNTHYQRWRVAQRGSAGWMSGGGGPPNRGWPSRGR